MKLRIGVKVDDPKAVFPVLKSDIEGGSYFNSENGISGAVAPQPSHHAFPGPDVIVLVFEFAMAISTGLIANWLYEKLRNKEAIIVLGKKEIRIENAEKLKEAIDAIVEEAAKRDKVSIAARCLPPMIGLVFTTDASAAGFRKRLGMGLRARLG